MWHQFTQCPSTVTQHWANCPFFKRLSGVRCAEQWHDVSTVMEECPRRSCTVEYNEGSLFWADTQADRVKADCLWGSCLDTGSDGNSGWWVLCFLHLPGSLSVSQKASTVYGWHSILLTKQLLGSLSVFHAERSSLVILFCLYNGSGCW